MGSTVWVRPRGVVQVSDAVGVAGDVPAGVGLVQMVVLAERAEVVRAGAPGRVRLVVVELAAVRRLPAAGGPAGAVAGDDVVLEDLGWAVDGGAVVEQVPGDRVDDQAGPGGVGCQGAGHVRREGAVADELGGVVPQAEQGRAGR